MSKVKAFDILRHMSEIGDNDLRLAPMSEVISARKVKAGTQVTIGVGADIIGQIANNELVGGFVFCSRKRYDEVKAELEAK